jgi:hypothetical protein
MAFAAARGRRELPDALAERHPAAAALVRQLLHPNPDLRPTAAQLLQHPLLSPAAAAAAGGASRTWPPLAGPQSEQAGAATTSANSAAGGIDSAGTATVELVLYQGRWHGASSLLKELRARDAEVVRLRAALAAATAPHVEGPGRNVGKAWM